LTTQTLKTLQVTMSCQCPFNLFLGHWNVFSELWILGRKSFCVFDKIVFFYWLNTKTIIIFQILLKFILQIIDVWVIDFHFPPLVLSPQFPNLRNFLLKSVHFNIQSINSSRVIGKERWYHSNKGRLNFSFVKKTYHWTNLKNSGYYSSF
jgi:hypothetical protein